MRASIIKTCSHGSEGGITASCSESIGGGVGSKLIISTVHRDADEDDLVSVQ